MTAQTQKMAIIYKKLGETPLEALERFRLETVISKEIPMTYAGRLDPMAEGQLIILIGEECKNKAKYLGIDKEYEMEIVFGISTDSYDALGLATFGIKESEGFKSLADFKIPDLSKYCGKFMQEYPPFSSKTVGGKQLHTLSRSNDLPEKMPTKEVEIYSIEKIGNVRWIEAQELNKQIQSSIDLVHGDFRQEEIKKRWNEILTSKEVVVVLFPVLKIHVKCSSGTYMRSLAERIGRNVETGAFALTIKRTAIK